MMNDELTETKNESSLMNRLGPVAVSNRGIVLATMDDVFRFAKAIALSQLCPPGFSETDCFLIIANGLEVGMSPMAALASTYIVNNRATVFGDMPLGLVRQSGLLEQYDQEFVGTAYNDDFRCVVTSKRKGMPKALTTDFSVGDAKRAGLWEKKGPWTSSPRRMLVYRARGFNLRDNFSDVLKGCSIAELDEGDNGFEHAKPAVGHVVAPHFEAPMTKRRGRPPKAPAGQQQDFLGTEPGSAEPSPQKGETTSSAAPAPEAESPVEEVVRRLDAAKLSKAKFVELLYQNGFSEGFDLSEIQAGQVPIEKCDPDGLKVALENWPQVLEEVKKL